MRLFGRLILPAALAALLLVMAVSTGAPPADQPDRSLERQPRRDPVRQVDLEIRDVLERRRTALEALRRRFEAAADAEASRAVRLEIRALLAESEIEIMEAQVRHLRREGNEAAAARLEASLEIMKNPEQRRRALVRPVERVEQGGGR